MIQYVIVGLLVLVAAIHLLRQMFRSARGSDAGCGTGCGCRGKTPNHEERLGRRIDLVPLGGTIDPPHKKAT